MKENINQLRKIKAAWQESNKILAMKKETKMKEMKEDGENEKKKDRMLKIKSLGKIICSWKIKAKKKKSEKKTLRLEIKEKEKAFITISIVYQYLLIPLCLITLPYWGQWSI